MLDSAPNEEKVAELKSKLEGLTAEHGQVARERDEYKKLYLQMLALNRKLERGLLGPQRERFTGGDAQLTMSVIGGLVGHQASAAATSPLREDVAAHTRAKPTGRRPLPDSLPRIDIEVLPP